MRIVSLLPAATEIVFAIGRGDEVVGTTFECDHPAEAAGRAVVVDTAMRDGLTPGEIDAVVRDHAAEQRPLQLLDVARLRALAPDVILTQDLCRVCGVPAGDVHAATATIGCDAEIVTLDPHSLEDVLTGIVEIGRRTDAIPAAIALVADLRARVERVERALADRPRVPTLLLEWIDPPFVAGHWLPEMVERAGGEPLLATAGERSRELSWDDAIASRPEAVVVAPCGYDLEAAMSQAAGIGERFEPRAPAVWAVDANGCFVRPGPRLVDGLEALAAALHPGAGVELRPDVCRRIAGASR